MVMKSVAAWCFLLLAVTASQAEELSCGDKLVADIYYLLDSSNSIHPIGWGRSLNFVANFSKGFLVGPEHVQFALGTFSTEFRHLFDLGQYTDRNDFEKAVLSTVQQKKNTRTYEALIAINKRGLLTSPTSGARPDVAKILIIVTDGPSDNQVKTIAAARTLRDQNVTIIVVGVRGAEKVELEGMAGDKDNIFTVGGFRNLDALRSQITQRVCVAKPPKAGKISAETSSPFHGYELQGVSIRYFVPYILFVICVFCNM